MAIFLFLINVLATLCFARNSLELSVEGRALVKRLDESTANAIDSVSKRSIGDVLGGLTIFVGAIALESLICVVLDLYIPTGSDAWRTYWRTLLTYSFIAGIAITWITRPTLLNQPLLGFSIWFPISFFLLPVMDLVTGTNEATRALTPIANLYKLVGIALPANAWAYAAATALSLMMLYLAAWLSMTFVAWVVVTPVAAMAFGTIKLAKWINRWFPSRGLTPLCFLIMIVSAAYSWSW